MGMKWKTLGLTLAHPITVGEQIIASATLREPNVEALEAIDDLGLKPGADIRVRHMRTILVAMSDLDNEAIGKLHRDDFAKMAEAVAPLLYGASEHAGTPTNS